MRASSLRFLSETNKHRWLLVDYFLLFYHNMLSVFACIVATVYRRFSICLLLASIELAVVAAAVPQVA